MIIDTSVLVAILRQEPEAKLFLGRLADADRRLMSAGSWIELGAVTSKDGDEAFPALLSRMLERLRIAIEPVSVEQARIGHDAYRRFGKGHHQVCLNFGDCFSYALAKATVEPLLFKGDDFGQTDITPALPT